MAQNFRGERVAVTGASGFIGIHLLRRLHELGANITAIVMRDRLNPRFESLSVPFERIVLDDVSGMGDVIRKAAPRYVVHLNAYISLERSLRAVEQSIQLNLTSTIALLTACTELKADGVVLMGSCEEYGQKFCPFDPSLVLDPNSPYGASKAAATCYARMFYGSFNLPTVVLRPSVAYGPGQSPRMLISMVLRALAEGRTVDVTAGRQTRDFVYIDDVVDSILIALGNPDLAGEAWNIGSGEIVTVRKCLEMIEHVTGRAGLIQYGARPYAESERFHYEPMVEETFKAFKWKPSVTLEQGLCRTWQALLKENSLQGSSLRGDL